MTPPGASDRSGLWAPMAPWGGALLGTFLFRLAVTETTPPQHWLGHGIATIWAFIGWLPILLFLRHKPQKDRT